MKARERWLYRLEEGDQVRLLRECKSDISSKRLGAGAVVGIEVLGQPGGSHDGMAILSGGPDSNWRSRELYLAEAVDPVEPGNPACLAGVDRSLWLAGLEKGDPVWVLTRSGPPRIACRVIDIQDGYLSTDNVIESFPVTTGEQGDPAPRIEPVIDEETWNHHRKGHVLVSELRDHPWETVPMETLTRVYELVIGELDYDWIGE